jgi:type VI secretion system protein ImpE
MASIAEQAIREGQLDEALAAVQDAVRSQPAKPELRTSLFQLLVVAGEWAKALRQLNVLSDLDPKMELLAATYRQLIACEGVRGAVFEGKRAPLCLGDPPDWYARLVEALHFDGAGQHAAAKELRDEAFASAEPTAGRCGDDAFAWLADADERLGPFLEAVVGGRYFWIPFARVRRIELDEPEDLRDLVWLPARLTWANSGEAVAFIPVRYWASEREADPMLRLGRRTDWRQLGAGSWRGFGQRMLATDQAEYALLDSRVIAFEPGSDEVSTAHA